MKRIIILLSIVVIFNSCLPLSYNVKHEEYDRIENPFTTDTVKFYRDILFNISIQKTIYNDHEYFTIRIEYIGNGWLFMDGYIVIKADDKIIKLKDSKPYRDVLSGGKVKEVISAIINDEDLEVISNSSNLRIQFHGSPVDIDSEKIGHIKQFYTEFN